MAQTFVDDCDIITRNSVSSICSLLRTRTKPAYAAPSKHTELRRSMRAILRGRMPRRVKSVHRPASNAGREHIVRIR